jgi:non-canonical (house-cleaning) NTP pyrophosphatase
MSWLFFFSCTKNAIEGMAARTLRACVASTNPVKVGAVQLALVACFPDRAVEVEGRDVPSLVADQPMGDEETKRGAMNRFQVSGLGFM